MFIFPPELKSWYLYGFSVNYFILTALFLSKINFYKKAGYWLLVAGYLFWLGSLHQRLPSINKPSVFQGPEFLNDQITVVKNIYHFSDNQPFSVYTYTPPIYDYQYQYLFWWYAKTNNLSLPVEYSYLPGESSYHPQKEYFINPSPEKPKTVFLIIEPQSDKSKVDGWLGHFAQLELVSQEKLTSGITIQTRHPALSP